MDLMATMAIEEIAREKGITTEEALEEFLSSPTATLLYDDSLKLWWDGPAEVAHRFLGGQSSTGLKSSLPTPQTGHTQSSGMSSNAVPGSMSESGSPTAGS